MRSHLDELLARIRALQEEVEQEYSQQRGVWEAVNAEVNLTHFAGKSPK